MKSNNIFFSACSAYEKQTRNESETKKIVKSLCNLIKKILTHFKQKSGLLCSELLMEATQKINNKIIEINL